MECETENRHQHSLEKTHKLKSLKHLIESMSRKAYWDYVEDLIRPKDEHSPEEKFSFSKNFFIHLSNIRTGCWVASSAGASSYFCI